jgi:hypothetical protein
MDFAALQRTWQEQDGMARAGWPAVEGALGRIRRLERRLLVRDAIEVAAALLVAFAFGRMAWLAPVAWPWATAAALSLAVGGFFVVDRLRRRRRPPAGDVAAALRRSLADVEHQMRLLGNVAWWYLAPLGIAGLLVAGASLWGLRAEVPAEIWPVVRWFVAAVFAFVLALAGAFFWWVRGMNLRAVETQLRPERDAIAAVLAELEAGEG